MLVKIVNDYMRSQWINYKVDVGFYAAKEELLRSATIMFCEPGTTTPKYVFKDSELTIPYPLPVIADSHGDFDKMYLNGDYSLTISNRDKDHIAMTTTNDDFNIEA